MKNYNFPVALQPIYTRTDATPTRNEIPGRKAVVAQYTGAVLGIVSTKYTLLNHTDVVEGFRKALKGEEYVETIKMAKNGAQLFATYSMPQHQVEVAKGDIVSMQFIVKNSYDGTNALHIMLGAFRLVCTNGMMIGKRFFTFTQKHIGSEAEAIDAGKLKGTVKTIADNFTKALPVMQTMSQTTVFHPSEYFEPKKVRIPKYLLEAAKESYESERDKSLWGVYNSLTWAITHRMKKENPAMSVYYGQLVWKETTKNLV